MTLNFEKDKINLSDERFQRGPVWDKKQEQLLIDTILREFDMPKLYFWSLKESSNYKWAVVDGQQRLTTIWRFLSNNFELSGEYTPEFANKKFKDLDIEQKNIILKYPLSIVYIEEADLDDIRDLFLRLQNGTTLKAAEKRINLGGNMSNFINKFSNHNIFSKVPFGNKHRDYEQILSQCMILELNSGPTNTQNKYLNEMYKQNDDFDFNSEVAKNFTRVFDYMDQIFNERTPELKRFNFVSMYLLISRIIGNLVIKNKYCLFKDFLIDFWQELQIYRNREDLIENSRDIDLDDYIGAISSRTDSLEAIKSRHEILIKKFLLKNPDLETYDNQRNFTDEQRLTIYRRDKMICWHCNKRVDWIEFEADHRPKPYSKGGKTIISNGICAHKKCNIKASDKENLIKGWLKE